MDAIRNPFMKSTILSLRHKLLIAALAVVICGNTPNVFGAADLLEFGQAPAKYDDVVVQDVLRVDTLRLESGEIVKLIGVRAFGNPARKKKIERDDYGFVVKEKADLEVRPGEQAQEYARELLEGKHVRLEFDAEQKDDGYKTLAYVFLVNDNTFVNARVLERGFADLQIQAPNLKYARQLRDAYREGRAYSHGMDE